MVCRENLQQARARPVKQGLGLFFPNMTDFDWDYYSRQARKDRERLNAEAWQAAARIKADREKLLAEAKKVVEQARKRGWVK